MAITRTPNFTSTAQYAYTVGKESNLFDEQKYQELIQNETPEDATQYALAISQSEIPESFDRYGYFLLNSDDKYDYFLNEVYQDRTETAIDEKTGETYNIYERNKAYFQEQQEAAKRQIAYNELDFATKAVQTVAGVIGNFCVEATLGTLEGLVNVAGTIIGDKEFVKQDTFGYSAVKEELDKWNEANSYLGKGFVGTVLDDISSGFGQMVVAAIPSVGQAIYFTSAMGRASEQALIDNPNMTYLQNLAYMVGTGVIEFATEKLFGDVLFKKGLFNLGYGGKASHHLITRLAADFATEGAEEFIAEIANSVYYKLTVNGNADLASFTDALYAGLIGGILGDIFSGSHIAKYERKTINGKTLTKFQSMVYDEQFKRLSEEYTKDSEIDYVLSQSQGIETIEETRARIKNTEGYKTAVAKKETRQKNLLKSITSLIKIVNSIGEEKFKRATELLNDEYEATLSALNAFKNKQQLESNGTYGKLIQKAGEVYNGTSFEYVNNTTPYQERYKNVFKKKYGVNVHFVKAGAIDGYTTQRAFVVDDQNIFINENFFENTPPSDIMNDVIEEELVHTLQYNKTILSDENIKFLKNYYRQKAGVEYIEPELKEQEYKFGSKEAEAQAKGMAKALLFDDITISDMVYEGKNIFCKVYRWMKNLTVSLNKKTEKGKLKFRKLQKVMFKYRLSVVDNVNNEEDVLTMSSNMNLNEFEKQQILKLYKEEGINQYYCISKVDLNNTGTQRIRAIKFLHRGLKDPNGEIDLTKVFDVEQYNNKFIEEVNAQSGATFPIKLTNLIISKYGLLISQETGTLVPLLEVMEALKSDFLSLFEEKDIEKINFRYSLSPTIASIININKYPKEIQDLLKSKRIEFIEDKSYSQYPYNIKDNKIIFNLSYDGNQVIMLTQAIVRVIDNYFGAPFSIDWKNIREGLNYVSPQNVTKIANKLFNSSMEYTLDRIAKRLADTVEGKNLSLTNDLIKLPSYFKLDGMKLVGVGTFSGIEINLQNQVKKEELTNRILKNKFDDLGLYDGQEALSRGYSQELANYIDSKTYGVKELKALINEKGLNEKTINLIFKLLYPNNINIKNYKDLKNAIEAFEDEYRQNLDMIDVMVKSKESDTLDEETKKLISSFTKEEKDKITKEYNFNRDFYDSGKIENILPQIISEHDILYTPVEKGQSVAYKNIKRYYKQKGKVEEKTGKEDNIFGVDSDDLDIIEDGVYKDEESSEYEPTYELYDVVNKQDKQQLKAENIIKINPEDVFVSKKIKERFSQTLESYNVIKESGNLTEEVKEDFENMTFAVDRLVKFFNKTKNKSEENIGKLKREFRTKRKAFENILTKLFGSQKDATNILNTISTSLHITQENAERKQLQRKREKLKKLYEDKQLPENKYYFETRVSNANRKTIMEQIDREIARLSGERVEYVTETIETQPTGEQLKIDTEQKQVQIETKSTKFSSELSKILSTKFERIKLQQVQDVDPERNEEYLVSDTREFLFKNQERLSKIQDNEMSDMMDELLEAGGQITVDQDTCAFMLAMYCREHPERFTKTTIEKAETLIVRKLGRGGKILGIWSRIFAKADPLDNLQSQFKQEYKTDLVLDKEDVKNYKVALRTRDYQTMVTLEQKFIKAFGEQAPKDRYNPFTPGKTFADRRDAFLRAVGKWNGFRYFAMLSNPSTHAQNLLSNVLIEGLTRLDETIIGKMEKRFSDNSVNVKKLESVGITNVKISSKVVISGEYKNNIFILKKNDHGKYTFYSTKKDSSKQNIPTNEFDEIKQYIPLIRKTALGLNQLKYNAGMKVDPNTLTFVESQFGDMLDYICKTGKYQPYSSELLLEQATFRNQYGFKLLQKMSDFVFDALAFEDKLFSRKELARKLALLFQANEVLDPQLLEAYNAASKAGITNIRADEEFIYFKIKGVETSIKYVDGEVTKMYIIEQTTDEKGKVIDVTKKEATKKELEDFNKNYNDIIKAMVTLTSKKIVDDNMLYTLIENAMNRTMFEFLRQENKFTKFWQSIMDKHPLLKMILSSYIPFPKVVSNITLQIFRHSPIGLARAFARLITSKYGINLIGKKDIDEIIANDPFYNAKTEEMLAQGITGTALTLIGVVLGVLGVLGFDDDDKYGGIVLNMGGLKLKMSAISPAGGSLLIGAALIHSETYPDLMTRITKILDDLTVLGTFNELFSYGTDLFGNIESATITYFAQYVPAILRSITKVIDYQKKTDYSNFFTTVFGRIVSGLPGLSYLLPNKVDPYTGNPVVNYGSTFLAILNIGSPIRMTWDTDNDLVNEAKRVDAATTGATGSFTINGVDYNLKGSQLNRLQTARGQYIQLKLTELMNDKKTYSVKTSSGSFANLKYSQMTDEQKNNVINTIYSQATAFAKADYWVSQGHTYVVTSYDDYEEYKNLISNPKNIQYVSGYSKSKFKE